MSDENNPIRTSIAGATHDWTAAGSDRSADLSALVSHLHRAHEEEKRLLARELHDELGSLLTAAKLDIRLSRWDGV